MEKVYHRGKSWYWIGDRPPSSEGRCQCGLLHLLSYLCRLGSKECCPLSTILNTIERFNHNKKYLVCLQLLVFQVTIATHRLSLPKLLIRTHPFQAQFLQQQKKLKLWADKHFQFSVGLLYIFILNKSGEVLALI